jgi:hypothetical protein
MAETMNMMEISVDKFTSLIGMDLEDENYDPVIGIGKSGVGKTMSIYELCQQRGIGFCELRLVTLTEVDLLGIPTITAEGRTTYASNDLLPNEERDGKEGILVLDEITSATSTIRAAAYQLLDSKRALGNYKLPAKWKIVALGNGIEDGGVFQGMENAFLSRATCYRIEPNLDSWKKWAIPNGVNPSILAYLTFEPNKLHDFDPDEAASIFPCPRSWTALSKKLNAREKKNGGMLPIEDVELYAAGAVGVATASAFAGFYSYNSKTISPEDILSGKSKGNVVQDVDTEVVYLMIQSLIKQLNKELTDGYKGRVGEFDMNCVQRAANLGRWIVDVSQYKLDYAVTCIRDLIVGVPLFSDLILANDDFDDLCPDLVKFSADQSMIFKPAN